MNNIELNDLKIIKGIEMDVLDNDKKYHFLCYNFDENNESFINYLNKVKEYDINEFKKNIKVLEEKYNLKFDEKITEEFIENNNYFDIVRMNSLIVLNGFSSSERDAFYDYTNVLPKHTRYSITFEEAMNIANTSHGILVLAHPHKYSDDINLKLSILDNFRLKGLKAFEAYCHKNTDEEEQIYLDYAKKYNMKVSAGSDYHAKYGKEEKRNIGMIRNNDIDSKNITIEIFT